MSHDDLDPELRSLLDVQADFSDMPEDAPAKILARVHAGLAPPKAGDGSADPGSGQTGSAPPVPSGAGKLLGAARRTATLVAFGGGVAVGVAGHVAFEHATMSPSPAPVVAPPPSLAVTASASTSAAPSLVPSAEPSAMALPRPTQTALPRPTNDDGSEDQDLATERAQLEIARTALARGESQAALATLRADAARRPRSRLAEERESLMVQALALSGHADEAHIAAASFAKRYPKSLFLPVVQAAVEGRP